jgi:hypothetical protein
LQTLVVAAVAVLERLLPVQVVAVMVLPVS